MLIIQQDTIAEHQLCCAFLWQTHAPSDMLACIPRLPCHVLQLSSISTLEQAFCTYKVHSLSSLPGVPLSPFGPVGPAATYQNHILPSRHACIKTCCLLPTVKLFTLYRLVAWCDILPAQLCANNAWRSAHRLQRKLLNTMCACRVVFIIC